jgi:DNA-binding beta-propeller fold protein YncE
MFYGFQWFTRFSLCAFLLAGSLGLAFAPSARATDLPPAVLNYLRRKNPSVYVRFDGLVRFPNGESYVPVIPQDPGLKKEAQQVISVSPEKVLYPDLIEFDNHYFLLRLIETVSGRLTFAKLNNYSIQLKEGLLPQDFVLPSNLFIPLELKVILGALPYNPNYQPPSATTKAIVKSPATASGVKGKPAPSSATGKQATAVTVTETSTVTFKPNDAKQTLIIERALGPENTTVHNNGYIFDLGTQKLFAINPLNGHKQTEVALDSVPSDLLLSENGKLLFASSQSNNELIIVDTVANLVKTRLPVGERPSALLMLPKLHQLFVSNMFSPFVSVVDTDTLLAAKDKIDLPGNGGVMALYPEAIQPRPATLPPPKGSEKKDSQAILPPPPRAAIADATEGKIYILNLETRKVDKTFVAPPDMSAMTVLPSAEGGFEIWAASRTKNQVALIDGQSGNTLVTMEVGRKPVAFANYKDTLYVLCAGDAKLSIINRTQRILRTPIPLEENSFPSAMMPLGDTGRAYITTAGADQMMVLNMNTGSIESTLPVSFRANLLALMPPSDSKPTRLIDPVTGITVTFPEKPKPPLIPGQLDASDSPKKPGTAASQPPSTENKPIPAKTQAFITPIKVPETPLPKGGKQPEGQAGNNPSITAKPVITSPPVTAKPQNRPESKQPALPLKSTEFLKTPAQKLSPKALAQPLPMHVPQPSPPLMVRPKATAPTKNATLEGDKSQAITSEQKQVLIEMRPAMAMPAVEEESDETHDVKPVTNSVKPVAMPLSVSPQQIPGVNLPVKSR